jgi:hypothetical protein
MLTAEQILAADDIRPETVEVPEWGGSVLVWPLTGAERDELELTTIEGKGRNAQVNLRNFRAKLVVRTVRDADGRRIFTDDQAAALGSKSAAALERIADVARRLSGLSEADVEELTGNSAPGQSDASRSG